MKILTPIKAMRTMFLECQGNSARIVTCCGSTDGWYYRFGKRPNNIRKHFSYLLDTHYFAEKASLHIGEAMRHLKEDFGFDSVRGVFLRLNYENGDEDDDN